MLPYILATLVALGAVYLTSTFTAHFTSYRTRFWLKNSVMVTVITLVVCGLGSRTFSSTVV